MTSLLNSSQFPDGGRRVLGGVVPVEHLQRTPPATPPASPHRGRGRAGVGGAREGGGAEGAEGAEVVEVVEGVGVREELGGGEKRDRSGSFVDTDAVEDGARSSASSSSAHSHKGDELVAVQTVLSSLPDQVTKNLVLHRGLHSVDDDTAVRPLENSLPACKCFLLCGVCGVR